MKVEKLDSFTKFTITVESEGEAMCLWHRLNMPTSNLQRYADGRDDGHDIIANDNRFLLDIFRSIDRIYDYKK